MKILTLVSFLFFSMSGYANGFLPIANVVKVNGKAFIDKEKEAVKVGDEVAKGMTINIPNPKDYIIVKYQNGHLVKMSGAKIVIEELTEKMSLLNLMRGKIFTFIKKLTPDEKFEMKTAHAAFAVRGTKFGLSINEKKKNSYLCVCEGSVEVAQGEMKTRVFKKEDIWVGKNAKKLESAPSGEKMYNDTLAEIQELESL